MVVILDEADYEAWLEASNDSPDKLMAMFETGRLVAASQ